MNADVIYIKQCLMRAREIHISGAILSQINEPYPGVWCSAYTDLLINLFDAMKHLKKVGYSINFTEDVHNYKDKTPTAFELIGAHRNAACHTDSGWLNNEHDGLLSFCQLRGTSKGFGHECGYVDDVAIIFGGTKVLYKRNLLRALELAEDFVLKYSQDLA